MGMKDKKLHMIGNAHLDPVWLWNWQEGFQEVKATFRSALDRMKEDENFIFTCSSAVFFEWVEKNNPGMFAEIKKRVEEGRWEIVGGWYIQPDCNIPSGESYVRQGLYGQRYFNEKFGKMAVTGYNVDSFGHNGNLPQILKKSGLDNYVFMRPMPLEKGLPGRVFWWKSEDGSKVLAYRIPYEYCTWGKDLEKYTERLKCELEDGEDDLMMFYGVGNHGGGPTRENLKSIYALNAREDMPVMEMGTTSEFFETIRSNGKEYHQVTGDLQHHASGCYSVMSRIKRENRRAENLLLAAEAWSTIASQALSWDIQIEEDVTMKPIVVFNTHAFQGRMVIDLEVRGLSNDQFRLTDSEGNVIRAQRIQSEAAVNGQSRLLFTANLQSMGYEVFKLYLNVEEAPVFEHVKVTEHTLENDRYFLEFNPVNGCMKHLIDKKADLEVLRREGARLAVIEDKSDTWSHNKFKFDKEIGDMKAVYIHILEDGPVRSTLRIKYKYNQSYVVSDFRLYKDLDYVEVKTKADWREPQTMLKVKYPVRFNFRKPTYEIPYGYIEKSANGEEEPGQTWFDFTGEHFEKGKMYGLAIANDAKYSYSFDVDEMCMTILKNSVFAHHDPKQLEEGQEYQFVDEGIQEFTYLLLPHEGTWKDSKIVEHAAALNQKPVTIIETYHAGSQPQKQSFLELKSDHIAAVVIKESEDRDGVIIRAYETKKQKGKAVLAIPFLNREAELDFTPCEIKTVKIPYDISKEIMEVNMLESV